MPHDRACTCPNPQPGWATGECFECHGGVSYEVYCASYSGMPSAEKPAEEIRAAIAAARRRRYHTKRRS